MKKIVLCLLAGLVVLACVATVRTMQFTSKQRPIAPIAGMAIDADAVASHLAEAIRFRTISTQDPAAFDGKTFLALHDYLDATFPRIRAALRKRVINEYSLLYTWPGADPNLKPILLLAHQDVVPVAPGTENDWTHPAFDGAIADGFVWGRGTIDDKNSLMGTLEAVEALLAEGYQPKRTVYLAFGHDEEVGGTSGAPSIAEALAADGVKLECVMDEGDAIITGILPGIENPVALIGIGEKGYLTLELSVETEGGHSSTPPPSTAIGLLSKAIAALEAHPFPADLAQAGQFFEYVGPEMPFLERMAFANLWLTAPLVKKKLAGNAASNATIRTTTAPTIFNAGVKENVLPGKATAVVNFRLLPGDTVAGVTDRVRKIIADDRVKIAALGKPSEPSPISDVNSASYAAIERTIFEIAADPGTLVAPFLVLGATDSRHFAPLAGNVFRFSPVHFVPEDLNRMHGTNERIGVAEYRRAIQFYVQFIRNMCSG